MRDTARSLLLDEEFAHVPFQSLIAFSLRHRKRSRNFPVASEPLTQEEACLELVWHIRDSIIHKWPFTNDIDTPWQLHIWHAIREMIRCERIASYIDHLVFYRVVDDKYVQYEFHTHMLRRLSLLKVPENSLVCTPSLADDDYPENMDALLSWLFQNTEKTDLCKRMALSTLSVNNCLLPTTRTHIRLHATYSSHVEGHPLNNFMGGYNETSKYYQSMEKFLVVACGTEEQEARACVEQLFDLHETMNGKTGPHGTPVHGHCIQIHVPRACLQRFVYPCLAYGRPLVVRRDPHHETLDAYGSPEALSDGQGTGIELVLDSPMLGELQSRIIGHPHLFCLHGASTSVFHGNIEFNADDFRTKMEAILEPFVQRALQRSGGLPVLHFRRYV